MKDILNIATVNFTSDWGNKDANLERILEYAEAAGMRGAHMLLIPETALTGYDTDNEHEGNEQMHRKLAEPIPGPSTLKVAEIAKKYHMYVIFGMAECLPDDPSTCFNVAAVIYPDGTCSSYRKMHLPYFLGEPKWAQRADKPGLIETEWGPMGLCICWETYLYPELLRYYRAKGCRMVINITAIPELPSTMKAAGMIPSHAYIYSMYIATAGLSGLTADGQTKFYGGSSVVGPNITGDGTAVYVGKLAGTEGSDLPGMFMGTVDLGVADTFNPFPVCDYCEPIKSTHYRPELYAKWYEELAKK